MRSLNRVLCVYYALNRGPVITTLDSRLPKLGRADYSGSVLNCNKLYTPLVCLDCCYYEYKYGFFLQEELGSLKSRLQVVTEENGRLHEELKEAVVKAVLQQEQFTQVGKYHFWPKMFICLMPIDYIYS